MVTYYVINVLYSCIILQSYCCVITVFPLQGQIDILMVTESSSTAQYQIHALENAFYYDASFLKVYGKMTFLSFFKCYNNIVATLCDYRESFFLYFVIFQFLEAGL